MTYQISCHYQTTENFNTEQCWKCPKFEMSKGKTTNYHCRIQKTKTQKIQFEGVILSKQLGIPDSVEIISEN